MAYALHWKFPFQSQNGDNFEIDIHEDGYSGSVVSRSLGRSPVLKREQNGHIYGTSLEFYVEAQTDGEFSSLYTSNPHKYRVALIRGSSVIWSGFVSPELYSEPDMAPPYDVCVTAVDGLGELKLHDFTAVANNSIRSTIVSILSITQMGSSLNTSFWGLQADSLSASNTLMNVVVDWGHLNDKTAYEALESILATFNACITRWGSAWCLFRENDISGSADIAITNITSGNYWPIGKLESEIVPARKSLVVKCPNNYKPSMLNNSDMASDTSWSKVGGVTFESTQNGNRYLFSSSSRGELSQSFALTFEEALELQFEYTNSVIHGSFGLLVLVSFTNSLTTYYLEGTTTDDSTVFAWTTDAIAATYITGDTNTSRKVDSFSIPPLSNPTYGTLTIRFITEYEPIFKSSSNSLWSAYLFVANQFAGMQLKVNLTNNARGEDDDVDSAFSYAGDVNIDPPQLPMYGVPYYSGSAISQWHTSKVSAQSYLGCIAIDYALLVANPRLRKKGKINMPSGASDPMTISVSNMSFIVKTFSWDLLNSELEFEAVSLPASSLTVESSTQSRIVEEGSSSRTSGGSSGGGGGGGGTQVAWGTEVQNDSVELSVAGTSKNLALANGYKWGTEQNNFADLKVGNTTKNVALSGHLHSEYAAAIHTHAQYLIDDDLEPYAKTEDVAAGYSPINHTHQQYLTSSALDPYMTEQETKDWVEDNYVGVDDSINADKIDGYHIMAVSSIPASPSNDTIYFIFE